MREEGNLYPVECRCDRF